MSEATEAYEAAEAAIKRAMAAGEDELDFRGEVFAALEELPEIITEYSGLKTLWLNYTQVADLAPLEGLEKLQALILDRTQVTDLTPLAGLDGLQLLWLDNTQVTDLSSLAGLGRLQRLWLNSTQVADLTPLAGLDGLQRLTLNSTQVTDLSPLEGLDGLQSLYLSITQVEDLTPLAGLGGLQKLGLRNTHVADLTPLAGLDGLQTLNIEDTPIVDLRPIMELSELVQELDRDNPYVSGLHFKNTPAAASSPDLTRLSEIEDNETRTRETLAYLKTLPPWPEPLPWEVPADPRKGLKPKAPKSNALPRLILSDDSRIDLAHSPVTDADQIDPIKKRLYDKLPDAVEALLRFGNRYGDVNGPVREMHDLVSVPFAEADILDIHLQLAALTDLRDSDPSKPKAEQMDADCTTALNKVLRLGPPVTMGHPDVDLFEARNIEYLRSRHMETILRGEQLILQGVAGSKDIATERLRKVSEQLAGVSSTGRSAGHRSGLSRNTIIVLGTIISGTVDAAIGYPFGLTVSQAAAFLLEHKDAIMATAPSWGETGASWAEYLLRRAKQIVDDVKNQPPN